MKILIGTEEICGWISLYEKELNKLNQKTNTFVFNKNKLFLSEKYDIVFSRFQFNYQGKNKWIKVIIFRINLAIRKLFLFFFIRHIPYKYDAVFFFWNSFSPKHEDIEYLYNKKVKLVFFFVGSDVRHLKTFVRKYNVTQWKFHESVLEISEEFYLSYIRTAEKYGNLIYSVPDQAVLQIRPYYHLQIPIDIDKIRFKNNFRKRPKVLHLPSDPSKKGTDIIEHTLLKLLYQGLDFEFISEKNLQNNQVLSLLQEVDILVDELIFHGPGVLSFEAMASGCAVATRYLEDSPNCFKPPVISIDIDNIENELKHVIVNYEYRQELIIKGRQYVEKNNSAQKIVSKILDDIKVGRPFDYFPSIEN